MIMVGAASFLRHGTFAVRGRKQQGGFFFFFGGQTQNEIIQVGREEPSQMPVKLLGRGL